MSVDLTHELNQVMLQQTQPLDCKGNPTIAALYANWYVSVLLRKTSQGGILYSPSRKSFVSRSNNPFKAEEYSDRSELCALCELIGPYGVRLVGERLMEQVSSQTKEVKRLVVTNKDALMSMHQNKDKPAVCRGYKEVEKYGRPFDTCYHCWHSDGLQEVDLGSSSFSLVQAHSILVERHLQFP